MEFRKLIYLEAEKIKDIGIRNFTLSAFSCADPMFWFSPCSSSGRFHPPEDNGNCGLLRHLIKASYVAENFRKKAMFTDYEMDMARAATILHDICKDGYPWGGKGTDYRHGIIGAEYLNNFPLDDRTAKTIILDAVRYHMSPWNTSFSPEKFAALYGKGSGQGKESDNFSAEDIKKELEEVKRGLTPHNIIETCVQEADYWASRSDMSFFPGIAVNLEERHDAE